MIRKATQQEIAEIDAKQGAENTGQSVALQYLIEDPYTWYHVDLNEASGTNLPDQMDLLVEEGKEAGYRIEVILIPGHPEGGFFGRRV